MDRFKSRFVDKKTKEIITQDSVDINGSLLVVGLHGLPVAIDKGSFANTEIIGWNVDHNYIIEQCTGLKDKNDKLIFEGDILKRYKKTGFPYKKVQVVEWRYAKFLGLQHHLECEVIGNIHENPELLGANQ